MTISTNNSMVGETTLEQYSDAAFNSLKAGRGSSKLLEYNSASKLGDKKAVQILAQVKQGNRGYIEKFIATPYPDPDEFESKSFLNLQFKSRDKFSDEMLPLGQTMIDSFRFIGNNTLQ